MFWIVMGGIIGVAVTAWAKASQRRVEAEEAERRERQWTRLREATLLSPVKEDEESS